MTLAQFLNKLVKRWLLIVICIVVLGVGAYIGSKLMTPIYQSTVLVQIAIRSSNNTADYNSLLASDQLVQTEAQLVTSYPVLREVASHYPSLTVEQLSKEVTSSPSVNTQLFEIDVQDPSATRAADLANDIAGTLIKQQNQLAQQGGIQTQQQLQQDLQQTTQQISSTTNQIAALPPTQKNQAQIATLKTQQDNLQQHYSQVQAALVQLELTQAQSGNFLLVVQPAQPALIPVRPNVLLNTGVGLLAGLLLAISLVLLLEQLDTRVRSLDGLSQSLGYPVLATILQAERKEEVVNPKGNNANVEAYRILRTNIGFSAIDKPLRTILITSATPSEGKSVIAANLAIFMAKAGKNTLLIDADFRRPRQHEQFNLPAQSRGFSNAIMAFTMPSGTHTASQQFFTPNKFTPSSGSRAAMEVALNPFIYPVGIPNLCVMPSGSQPPNPPELLDSKAMQQFLAVLDSCGAETVIFDAPPLLGLSDANILASKVDGTLVVVDITRANRGNLKQVKAMLIQAGAHIIGVVVNKQHRSRDRSIYSYYSTAPDQDSLSSDSVESWPTVPVTPVMHTPPATPVIWSQPETKSQWNTRDR